ncbi:23S rRNA (guanosine(2251)-2'-O)-methyltransferase RlmB [Candidatus Poriferisocius sp.]|uniref:23S rRNA (guanosine(2251)-2'-O)-methyltransferase RlmB n=1 Tax=Candidatus Poriferisocius sp. TaxID=3101276 RepID=UPI003B02B501
MSSRHRGRGRGHDRGGGRRGGGRPSSGGQKARSRSGLGGDRVEGRQARSRSGLGGDRVEGRQAVRELLLAGTRPVHEIVIGAGQNRTGALAQIVELATELRVPIKEVAMSKFESMAATEVPQGVMARAAPLTEHDLDELASSSDGRPPFLLVLDGITDPGNLGAALRTAEGAGVTGAVLGRHRSAHITPAAAKAAAGAVEHVPMAVVAGIPTALSRLAELGVWTVGLDTVAPITVYEMNVAADAVALVVGSEGRGLSRLVRQRCDIVVTIPLSGNLGSLNAAAATAIGCFEVARHRRTAGSRKPAEPASPRGSGR